MMLTQLYISSASVQKLAFGSLSQVEALAEHMRAESHTVSAIHGEQLPEERKRIMKVCVLRSSGGCNVHRS